MRALTELVDVARARSGSEFRFEANAVRRHAAICSRPWWQESKKRAKQPKKMSTVGHLEHGCSQERTLPPVTLGAWDRYRSIN